MAFFHTGPAFGSFASAAIRAGLLICALSAPCRGDVFVGRAAAANARFEAYLRDASGHGTSTVREAFVPATSLLERARAAAGVTNRVASVALVVDVFGGWRPPRRRAGGVSYCVWDSIPYDEGDFFTDAVLDLLYPGYRDAIDRGDAGRVFSHAPYGDIADIFTSDIPLAVMRKYAVVVLAGRLRPSKELEKKLKLFLRDGGHLVLPGGNAVTWERATDDFAGVGRVTRFDTPWGLHETPVLELPVKCADGEAIPTPFPLSTKTRALLDGIFRDAALHPFTQPPIHRDPRTAECFLALRGQTPVIEQLLARPTFSSHFDGVALEWSYLAVRSRECLADEGGRLADIGVRVVVIVRDAHVDRQALMDKSAAIGAKLLVSAPSAAATTPFPGCKAACTLSALHAAGRMAPDDAVREKADCWIIAACEFDGVNGGVWRHDLPVVRTSGPDRVKLREMVCRLAASNTTLILAAAYADPEEEYREVELLLR